MSDAQYVYELQQAQIYSGFLSKCPTCKYMIKDEDIGDMLCEMNDCHTCMSTAIDLQLESVYVCDAYKEKNNDKF